MDSSYLPWFWRKHNSEERMQDRVLMLVSRANHDWIADSIVSQPRCHVVSRPLKNEGWNLLSKSRATEKRKKDGRRKCGGGKKHFPPSLFFPFFILSFFFLFFSSSFLSLLTHIYKPLVGLVGLLGLAHGPYEPISIELASWCRSIIRFTP